MTGINYYTKAENIHVGKHSKNCDQYIFTFSSKYLRGDYDDRLIVNEFGETLTRETFYYGVVEHSDIYVQDGDFC